MEVKNTFSGGLNRDIDNNAIPKNTYRDAVNVKLLNKEGYFSVQNLKGASVKSNGIIPLTEIEGNIADPSKINLLGSCLVDFRNSSEENEEAIVLFYTTKNGSDYTLKVKAYLLSSNITLNLFSQIYEGIDYSKVKLDYVIFGENGYDNIYFTLGLGVIKKIKCIYSFIDFDDYSSSLIKHMPLGGISEVVVSRNTNILQQPILGTINVENRTSGELSNFSINIELSRFSDSWSISGSNSIPDQGDESYTLEETLIPFGREIINYDIISFNIEFDKDGRNSSDIDISFSFVNASESNISQNIFEATEDSNKIYIKTTHVVNTIVSKNDSEINLNSTLTITE